jgi:GRAM domain
VRFLKMAALTGVPFGFLMGLFFAVISGLVPGLVAGLFAGLLFGLALATFTELQRDRFTREGTGIDGEAILKQGPANHFRGAESVGGWLFLTHNRLLFRSHRLNVQSHELSIPLTDISEAQTCATLGFIPNGLRVFTPGGAEQFVVEGRQSWVAAITQAKGSVPMGT